MTFYLSEYRKEPLCEYLIARIRFATDEIEQDTQIGLNVIYIDKDTHTAAFYPFQKTYKIQNSEWERWCNLNDFDAISVDQSGICYCFYEAGSGETTIVTGLGCNTNCVMCPVSESSRIHAYPATLKELTSQIAYFGTAVEHITITGGEPTLLKQDLLEIIKTAKQQCPSAEILILTNGRTFCVNSYAKEFIENLSAFDRIAIPIHGSTDAKHDAITQSKGFFNQTIRGLQNLAVGKMQLEIRVVVSKLNCVDISNIADIILQLPRVTVVYFIGLEMCGNAIKNRDRVWIDYSEAANACEDAIEKIIHAGIDVGLYNFPLCAVKRKYWSLCKDSISDYKIRYKPECATCAVREICNGVFSSTISTGCFVARPIME